MTLFRKEFSRLRDWYQGPLKKSPCILFGARQVGKSTMATCFAEQTGRQVFVVNFWKDTDAVFSKIFSRHAHARDIIQKLEIHFNRSIDPQKAILVLDEIQEHPVVYALFKTLKEDTDLPIIATGSYLKLFLSMTPDVEVPVGCTHELLVTPLTFREFLHNAHKKLFDVYETLPLKQIVEDVYHKKFLELYYEYLFTGGMPEVVDVYLNTKKKSPVQAAQYARKIQMQLLTGYQSDFLTFNQKKIVVGRNIVEKLALAFATIPKELAKYKELQKSVGRFKFMSLGKNSEYRRVSHVFDYLALSGLIIKTHLVKNPSYPLINEDENKNAFKCFYFDVGVLQAALKIPYKNILSDDLSHYKGPIAENFVAQQLFSIAQQDLFSYKNRNREIEFLYEHNEGVIPIEVKSSKKSAFSKSLQGYVQDHKPDCAIKVAPRNFGEHQGVLSVPIYMIEKITKT